VGREMCSLKAFINENHSQKIAPWSTAIFPYFTALTERKLSLGLTGCHKKKFSQILYLGRIFPPTVTGGGRPSKQNLKH